MEELASRCSCGEPRDVSFLPENEGAYDVDIMRCHACTATTKALHEYESTAGLAAVPHLRERGKP